jgi:hypothetical protein
MAECEFLTTCPFFNDQMQDMPATAEIYKARYCRGNKGECARYMVKMEAGKDHVLSDLFPNQVERAEEIISRHKS